MYYILPYDQTPTSSPESTGNETVYGAPGDVSNRNDLRNNGVISDGSLRRFTEGRRIPLEGDINIGSEAGRVGYDDDLELFPLHPDGNLKSNLREHD